MNIILQILLVLALLAIMVMVLLGISQLGNRDTFENYTETDLLKNEVEDTKDVISDRSIFNALLHQQQRENEKKDFNSL